MFTEKARALLESLLDEHGVTHPPPPEDNTDVSMTITTVSNTVRQPRTGKPEPEHP